MVAAVLKLWKGAVKGKITGAVVVITCALAAFTNISSIALVVAAGILGILFSGKIENIESSKKTEQKEGNK